MDKHISDEKPNCLSIDESLRKIDITFRLIGLNFEMRDRKLKEDIIFWFNIIWMNIALVGCFYYTRNGLLEGIDFKEISFIAPGAILSIMGNFKGFFSFGYEDKIKTLLGNLRKLEKNNNIHKLNEVEEKMIESDVTFLHWVLKVFNVFNVMMLLVYDLNPIVLIAFKYYRTKELTLMLPFLDIYSFDSFDLRIWPFLYIHQIWSEAVVLLQVCSADYLFYICCTYIRIQFRLLNIQLETVLSNPENVEDSVEIRQNFLNLILWHQDLIRDARMLEVITSKSTLSNFIMSSLVICLAGFNVTVTDDFTAKTTFVTFLFMSLLQIFFLCLFGDMLMRSSTEVSDAVYNCKWYSSDVATCKNVLLIQTRAQIPCKVTAFGFADVNLKAYMRVLSTSWSYFALLKTVYGSNRT